MKSEQLNEILQRNPSLAARNRHLEAGGVPSHAEPERSAGHEPMEAKAGKGADAKRHLVCLTSFRVRLCDERNLYDKYFTDALTYAGAILGDSPKEIEIKVEQVKVDDPGLERTYIEIMAKHAYNKTRDYRHGGKVA